MIYYYPGCAQHLITTGWNLDDLDRDLPDLSVRHAITIQRETIIIKPSNDN